MPNVKYCALLVLVVITTACSSQSDKARSLIEKDLKNSSINWLSYQFVEISKLDTLYSTPTDEKQFAHWCNIKDSLDNAGDNPSEEQKYTQLIKNFERNYKKRPIGWTCNFKFSSENKYGARYTSTYYYSFDKDIAKITNQVDITPPADKQPNI
jgi:hypothetical protein